MSLHTAFVLGCSGRCFLCDTAAMFRDQVEETACLNQFMQFIAILKQEINVSNGKHIKHPSKYAFSM